MIKEAVLKKGDRMARQKKQAEPLSRLEKERAAALKSALAQIEKEHGAGAIMIMGEKKDMKIEGISTSSIGLDLALGGKGLPKGRIVEIFGPESSGKTTLALHVCAQAQKAGGRVAFIDAEHALDIQYAKKLGLNADELLLSQPDYGEQAMSICEALVKSNALDVIVIDSVAALTPKVELDGEMGQSHVGLQARMMSQALRKLTGIVHNSGCMIIFINQIREKIGVTWGSPETTPGGRALKFYSSVRLDIRRIGMIKQGDKAVGNQTKVKVIKNKIAAPFQVAEFEIIFGQGICRLGELLDYATANKIVNRTGAWYSFQNEKIGQGKENAKKFLKENKDILEKIEKLTLEAIAPKTETEAKEIKEAPKN